MKAEQNELITRIGPGTPCGELMRRYWQPVALVDEFNPAQSGGVDGIAADCGGMLTCATCHVFVREPWASQLPPPGTEELAMLEFTADLRRPNSRLSCQIQLTEALDGLTVDLPATQY